MTETPDTMRRRLYMRSIRRGIKEMDLILSAFAKANLGRMEAEMLGVYDRLLSENDHDLYAWVSGAMAPPAEYGPIVARIAAGAEGVAQPGRTPAA